MKVKTVKPRLRLAQDLSKTLESLSSEELKKLKADPSFIKHAKTIFDYYSNPLFQLCQQIDGWAKKVNSDPVEVAMWALSFPDDVVKVFEPQIKNAAYTSSEMVKWLKQQKQANLVSKRVALKAPKVEIDDSYNDILKQKEFIK